MKKKLFRSGGGWALFLPKPVLELLDIDPENNQVEIEINNKILTVKKAAEEDK